MSEQLPGSGYNYGRGDDTEQLRFTVDVDTTDPPSTTIEAVGSGHRSPPGWPSVPGTVREHVYAADPDEALTLAVGYVLARRRRRVPPDAAGAARFAAADRAATERAS